MGLIDACGCSAEDLGALKVSENLEFDESEGFDAHYGDEIGWSAIEQLARISNKEIDIPNWLKNQGIGAILSIHHTNKNDHKKTLDQNHNVLEIAVKENGIKIELAPGNYFCTVCWKLNEVWDCMSQRISLLIPQQRKNRIIKKIEGVHNISKINAPLSQYMRK